MIFFKQCGAAEPSNNQHSQMIRKFGELWKALPASEKASYLAKAAPGRRHRPVICRYLSESDDEL
jgi:hypothetical protein